MTFKSKTNYREFLTVKCMIEIYCEKKHGKKIGLCQECNELLAYAKQKLQLCPFYNNKPACKDCEVHCYQQPFSNKIIDVMKFSGPRMLIKHPVFSISHLWKSIKVKLVK